MEFKIGCSEHLTQTNTITIFIGEDRYRLTEVDGMLSINKMSDGETDNIRIHPRYTNEIEIN